MTLSLTGWLAAAIAALTLAGAVQTYRIERLHSDLKVAREQTKAAKELTKASENARDRESKAATASFEGLQTTCATMSAAGIQKGRTIERIVSVPSPPAGGSRGIVGAGELRGVLGQDAGPRTP